MSWKLRWTLGAMWLTGSTVLMAGGNTATAQEPIVPPAPGIVLEVTPSSDGDVLGIVPEIHAFSATLTTDGGPVFFARSVDDTPESLLEMGNVQKELDLIDEQKEKIRAVQRKMQERTQKHFAEMHERRLVRIRDLQDEQGGRSAGGRGPARGEAGGKAEGSAGSGASGGERAPDARRLIDPPEEFKKSQERLKELREELAKEIDNILLPHQRRRLEEISLRMKMKQRGTSGSLVDTELAKTLGIDDAQKDRIRRRAAEVQKELEEKIAKLREEAREEILDELSPDQQRKLKDMLGSEFDDKPQIAAPPRIRKPRPAIVDEKPAADKATEKSAEKSADGESKASPEAEQR